MSTLNPAQVSGLAGVKEQLERAYALVSGAQTYLKSLELDVASGDEGALIVPNQLLDMAAEELADFNYLKRIEEGQFDNGGKP